MNAKIKLQRLRGRPSSSPAPHIGFRFKTGEEDIEELPYEAEKNPTSTQEYSSLNVTSRTDIKSPEGNTNNILDYNKDNDKNEVVITRHSKEENAQASPLLSHSQSKSSEINVLSSKLSKEEIREPSPVRDSVKGYLSKLSKRSNNDPNSEKENTSSDHERRNVLRSIKGKIAKTIEERLSKENVIIGEVITKQLDKEPEKDEKEMYDQANNSIEKHLQFTKPVEHSEEIDSNNLSPSVEATESLDCYLFENYECDDTETAKCVISSSPTGKQKTLASVLASGGQSLLPPKMLKSHEKPDISMSYSSLIANRSDILDNEYDDNKEFNENEALTSQPDVPAEVSDSKPDFKNTEGSIVKNLWFRIENFVTSIISTWTRVIFAFLFVLLSCLFAPLPSYLSGFLSGCIFPTAICFVYWTLMKAPNVKEPFVIPDFSKKPPLVIPLTEIDHKSIVYQGWMNELFSEYNPDTYHVNNTYSVYIRLDGSYLRVSHPKSNIPKRAMFNETRHELAFLYQRHYDISTASLTLLPFGLARTRLWSKKYPICLTIPNSKEPVVSHSSSYKGTTDNSGNSFAPGRNIREISPIKKRMPKVNENSEIVLHLFARSDREKDEWYRRFQMASKVKVPQSLLPSVSLDISSMEFGLLENKRAVSVDLGSLHLSSSCKDISSSVRDEDDQIPLNKSKTERKISFNDYMDALLSPPSQNILHKKENSDIKSGNLYDQNQPAQNLLWLNALLGRLFYDVLTIEYWSKFVSQRIQRKLSKIKLPHFMEELTVTDIDLGTALPMIHRASNPVVDRQGLWVDLDLSYNGSFQMTLETKLNLMRLKRNPSGELSLSELGEETEITETTLRSPVYNSEEEDSAESSSDEDISMPDSGEHSVNEESFPSVSASGSGSTGKKLLWLVDKIAQSSYFQNATKHKYIKRAMEGLSNTPIVLTVEVQWLTGTLALNIPPLPTDRLWYGFRTNPHLSIVARPKLGEHIVTLTHIIDWIEKKLVSEFQKILVMPNMDNIVIPIMHSDISQKT